MALSDLDQRIQISEYALPLGRKIEKLMQKTIDSAPDGEKGLAFFSATKVLAVALVTSLREVNVTREQGHEMIDTLWKSMDAIDMMQAEQEGKH